MRKGFIPGLAVIAAAAFSAPAEGAEQQSYSGIPLVQYCNVAPDLSVKRTDSVGNWVKICSIWLAANGGRAGGAQPFGRWPSGLGVDRRGPNPGGPNLGGPSAPGGNSGGN